MARKQLPLSGSQKVAAFLLSLDKQGAAAVLKNLDQKVVFEVAEAMTELDARFGDRTKLSELYRELTRMLIRPPGPRPQDDLEVASMFEAALGRDKAKAVITEIHERRRHERPFAIIEKEPPELLARGLIDESPAVSALVLAHLSPELSAEILSTFEPERALDIVRRMSSLFPPGYEALNAVAETLKQHLAAIARAPVQAEPSVRLKSIAQMLTFTEPEIEKAVLEGLSTDSQEMAAEIREFMFTWNDLSAVDKRGMQKILGSIETRTLAIALKGCAKDVEENILGNLSVRVRAMVADERELAGAMPMTEIVQAREEIMKSVRALMDSGEFKVARAGEDLVT